MARSKRNLVGAMYRKSTDWIKPTLDRFVDSSAFFIGANASVSTAVYHGRQALEQSGANFLDNDFSRMGAYLGVYGLANFAIIPLTKKIFERKTNPSWPNHIKTWAILGTVLSAWYFGGVKEDANRIRNSLRKADTTTEFIDTLLGHSNLSIFEKYLSGKKMQPVVRGISDLAAGLENLINDFGFELEPTESGKIDQEVERVSRSKANPDFAYSDKVSKYANRLNAGGMDMTPEQLAYLARVVYFEGAFDRKAKNTEALLKGMEGIAHVILNRWKYDNNSKTRPFSNKGREDMFDVAFKSGKKRRGNASYRLWQFTAIRDHPSYFYEHKGKKKWDMYANGRINIAVGDMDSKRANLAYKALLNVLSGKVKDPTRGALFYQNVAASDRYNKNWRKRGLDVSAKINSHTFYRPSKKHPLWKKKMLGGITYPINNVAYFPQDYLRNVAYKQNIKKGA